MGPFVTLWWLLLSVGCAPRTAQPPPTGASFTLPQTAVVTTPTGQPVAAGPWSNGTVSVTLPDGWSGVTGPPGASLLLRVTEPVSLSQVELWSFAPSGRPAARPRPGCEPILDDRGRYRAVPALDPAASHSCVEADGTLVQGWYSIRGGQEVHIEAIYPPGEGFRGRLQVEPFLSSLAVTR
ncbi:MAG: hypothetical protein ACJAZO_003495 [Myxococcota bacterium]|jgi:hypothetical protein